MARILVTYAASNGAREAAVAAVAAVLAAELRDAGHLVTVASADSAELADHYDAVVVGSDLHGQRWAHAATTYLKANERQLAHRPTFLFESVDREALIDSVDRDAPVPTPHDVRRIAFDIGTALPVSFGLDIDHAEERTAVACWAHSIHTALASPADGLPSGYWSPAVVGP